MGEFALRKHVIGRRKKKEEEEEEEEEEKKEKEKEKEEEKKNKAGYTGHAAPSVRTFHLRK